jgi:hypothetical protein
MYVSCEGAKIRKFDSATGEDLGTLVTGLRGVQKLIRCAQSGRLRVPGDSVPYLISRITPEGTVTTFASGGGLSLPFGLGRDSAGNYYAPNFNANTVSKVSPAGVVSAFVDRMPAFFNRSISRWTRTTICLSQISAVLPLARS